MEKVPQPIENKGEIMPAEHLKRGNFRSITDELAYHEEQGKRPGTNYEHVRIYDIDPLLAVQNEGYKFIMCLPRVNHVVLQQKYGLYYDKLVQYFAFVDTLARRNGITRLKHTTDDFYVFDTEEDAEKLKQLLIEKQEQAELEFEIIEGSSGSSLLDDQTDTTR